MFGSVFGMLYGISNRFYEKLTFVRENDDIRRKLL